MAQPEIIALAGGVNTNPLRFRMTIPTVTTNTIDTDATNDPYMPKALDPALPHMPGQSDIEAEQGAQDFGQIMMFRWTECPNDVIPDLDLIVQLNPITASGGGTNARYVNDPIGAGVEYIDLETKGNPIQRIYPDYLHFQNFLTADPLKYDTDCRKRADNLTKAQRVLNATGTQTIYYPLKFWFTYNDRVALHQYLLSNAMLKFKIVFRQPEYVLQQDNVNARPVPAGGLTRYIQRCFIRARVTTVSDATTSAYAAELPVMQHTMDLQHGIDNIAVGETSHHTLLHNLSRQGPGGWFMMRPQSTCIPLNYTTYNPWALAVLDDGTTNSYYNMFGQGMDMTPKIFHREAIVIINNRYYPNETRIPLYPYIFSDTPDEVVDSAAGIEFIKVLDPYINIQFSVAVPAALQVDYFWPVHNTVTLGMVDGIINLTRELQLT